MSAATAAPLKTPSDLKPADTKAVASAINGLLADAFALYLKTKNFHWHMRGPHFRDYHLLLDAQSAQLLATTDPLAERVRKIGEATLRSISDIGKHQSIKDDNRDSVTPMAMLQALLEDNQAMVKAMRKAHDICDDANDVATASLLENYIDETEERVWFLFEITQAADTSGH